MYNYPFRDNEEYAISEKETINCKVSNKNILVNVLLTNKNILIFYDSDRDNPIKSSGIQTMPEYEVLFKIPLNNMDYTIISEDTLLNIEGDSIILYNFNIKDFIEKDD